MYIHIQRAHLEQIEKIWIKCPGCPLYRPDKESLHFHMAFHDKKVRKKRGGKTEGGREGGGKRERESPLPHVIS
jgi:hypothetical protein